MLGFDFGLGLSARGQVTIAIPGVTTISGTLPDAIVGQAYDASLTVTPSGSAITPTLPSSEEPSAWLVPQT